MPYIMTITETSDDYKRPHTSTDSYTFESEDDAYLYASFYFLRELADRDLLDHLDFEDVKHLTNGEYKSFVSSVEDSSAWTGEYVPTTLSVSIESVGSFKRMSDDELASFDKYIDFAKGAVDYEACLAEENE